jgi:D-3-phosphoglycerate dehydrogenase
MSPTPNVLITDQIHESAVRILRPVAQVHYHAKLTDAELRQLLPDMDALMIRSASKVTAQAMAAAPRLKIIGRAGVGTDNIDVSAATQRGIIVVNSPEGNTVAAAEHTVGMLMSLVRHIPRADALMKQGTWNRALVGVEVFGKTLGILGLGKIGARVAHVCQALGMQVLVYDPFLPAATAKELGVTSVPLDALWEQADFITIHAPKTPETTGLLNAQTLARCKPGLRLVNCARGGIVDETALAEALASGQVAGAALDVFSAEPLPADHPLFHLPESVQQRLVLTPHLGASTEEAQLNVALDVAQQIRDFFEHGFARNAVNLPMLRKELLDPVKPYMPLAEILGSMARQLADGPADHVEITAKGTLASVKTAPLTLAVLKGILSHAREGVNYVNAPLLAEESGLGIKESATKDTEDYLNLITVSLYTRPTPGAPTKKVSVAGTLIAQGIYRVVALDGYRTTITPETHMLFTPHKDQPGMIAGVATLLGREGINISGLQVARRGAEAGGESVMIFSLDNPPSPEVLEEIRRQPGIYGARTVSL